MRDGAWLHLAPQGKTFLARVPILSCGCGETCVCHAMNMVLDVWLLTLIIESHCHRLHTRLCASLTPIQRQWNRPQDAWLLGADDDGVLYRDSMRLSNGQI